MTIQYEELQDDDLIIDYDDSSFGIRDPESDPSDINCDWSLSVITAGNRIGVCGAGVAPDYVYFSKRDMRKIVDRINAILDYEGPV